MSYGPEVEAPTDPEQIRRLIEMFFGLDDAEMWAPERPHAALGLVPTANSPAIVMAALQDRLAVVRGSPLAGTAHAMAAEALLKQAASVVLLGSVNRPPRISEVAAQRAAEANKQEAAASTSATGKPAAPKAMPKPLPEAEPIPLADDADGPLTAGTRVPQSGQPTPPLPPPLPPNVSPMMPQASPAVRPAAMPVSPQSPRPSTPQEQAVAALRQRAIAILSSRGRVDAQTLRELQTAAVTLGLPAAAATQVISQLANGGVAEPARAAAAGSPTAGTTSVASALSTQTRPAATTAATRGDSLNDDQTESEDDPSSRLLKRVIIGGLALVTLCVVALSASLLLSKGGGGTGATPAGGPAVPVPGPASAGPTPTMEAPTKPAPKPVVPQIAADQVVPSVRDAATAAAAVRSLADEPGRDGPAAKTVRDVLVLLCRTWPRLDKGQRVAVTEVATDLISRLPAAGQVTVISALGPQGSRRVVDPADVVELTGRAGLVARLSRERELGAQSRAEVRRVLTAYGAGDGGSFDVGAAAALRTVPLRLVASGASAADLRLAWQAYELAAAALANSPVASADQPQLTDPQDLALREAATPFMLEALEQMVRGGPDPLSSKPMHDSLAEVAGRLTWSAQSAARARLMAWFDERGISTVRLGIVTAAISQRSGAEGIDLTMALSSSADQTSRQEMRARYAEAWKLTNALPPASRQEWLARLGGLSAKVDSDAGRLFVAAAAADANRYFFTGFSGTMQPSEPLIPETIAAMINAASNPGLLPNSMSYNVRDGAQLAESWGIRYFAERNAAVRVELVRQLESRGPLDPVDADALLDAAVFGGSSELRNAAGRAAAKRSSEALVMTSLLEVLPRMNRSRASAELVALMTLRQLPDPESPEYALASRRAVIERLTDLLAMAMPIADVESQATRLAEMYRATANGLGANVAVLSPDGFAGDLPAEAAELTFNRLRSRGLLLSPPAEVQLTLQQVETLAAARAAAAATPIRRFAAWQSSLLELTALLVASDRPACAKAVREVLDETADRRRKATGIAQQIMHTEMAMTRIWIAWEAHR